MNNSKTKWTLVRTLGFIIVGLMNTVLAKPEDIGTWKNYLGYGLLIIAAIEIVLLIRSLSVKKRL